MRKHSVRKWLHAILDLLPLFVIPIFAIFTRNENYNSDIELNVEENKIVHFNQIANYTYYYRENNDSTLLVQDNYIQFDYAAESNFYDRLSTIQLSSNHVYYLRSKPQYYSNSTRLIERVSYGFGNSVISFVDVNTLYTPSENYVICYVLDARDIYITESNDFVFKTYFNVFDLTLMFGAGNEPTISQFETWYPLDNYVYTIDNKQFLENYGTLTYNDTDVGSQLIYTLYNTCDKYFNFNNTFNLGSIWNWIEFNLFNGNAPLIVSPIWNIICYEFLMDLLFVFYAFFMFLMDFIECVLEKPFNRINRR